ncbi:hypothetical protein MRX96_013075 [Rhipicephalus microplus]
MAMNDWRTTALDAALTDAKVVRNCGAVRPLKAQKREGGRVASSSVQVACSSERYRDEPPPKIQKPDIKAREKQIRQQKPPPARRKPAINSQERRLRPLAPKLQPNAGVLLNSVVPPSSGIMPNFGLFNAVNSKQGMAPLDSSKPVTLLLLCKPVRPDTSQTSLLKPGLESGRGPGITIVTSNETGVVYTVVTKVGDKETDSHTSNNAMLGHVTEGTGETEIIGIPTVDIGVKQGMSWNHEGRTSTTGNRVVLYPSQTLKTDPARTTGIARVSVTENDTSELCRTGVTPVNDVCSSSELLTVGMPTPDFHLEHCESEGHASGISVPGRTMLAADECAAAPLTMISNLKEQTVIVRRTMMEAEKALFSTSNITSQCSAKGCSGELAIIGIPALNIDTEPSVSGAGEKQGFMLCSPSKIKLEPLEHIDCEASEDNNTVLNPPTAVESMPHKSCTSTNVASSPMVDRTSKLAAFRVTREGSDVVHRTSTAVMEKSSSAPAQSRITSFPAIDVATVNNIPLDKTALFGCQLKLVKDKVFELCAPSSDTGICANNANDSEANSTVSNVPQESSVVEHSVSTAVESRVSASYSSCNAMSSTMKCTSSNISVLSVCNQETSDAPSTMKIPQCPTSLPCTSSNTITELETRMDDSNSYSQPKSVLHRSAPSIATTTIGTERGSLKNPLDYLNQHLLNSLHSSERTKEIVHALEHKITVPRTKLMFYREKVNALKLQFHNAQRIMKQPLKLEDFRKFDMSVPSTRVADV